MSTSRASYGLSIQEEDDWVGVAMSIPSETGPITFSQLESWVRGLRYVKQHAEVQYALTFLSRCRVTQGGAPVDQERVVKKIRALCNFSIRPTD